MNIFSISVHYVRNPIFDKPSIFSNSTIKLSDEVSELLARYFLSSNKEGEYYRFSHLSDLRLNEIYQYVGNIFSNKESLHKQSVLIAKYLTNKTKHPKIKNGEFYTVYFKNCLVNGQSVDAIGLFKSENKDTFLKVEREEKNFTIHSDKGININNLDKGCLIFNLDAEDGYWVSIVDKSGKGSEAQYWKDDFLGVKPKTDDFAQTQHLMTTCKRFVTNELADKGMSSVEQADLLNKSMSFFKEHKQFDIDKFNAEVFADKKNIAHLFDNYKQEEEKNSDLFIPSTFAISENAVKKLVRSYKKIIHLDETVDIHLLNDRHNIEQGEDEKGRFYKIYFKAEK